MTVHLFGCTLSPSCAAFCLREAARRFGSDFSSGVSKVVCRNFYVDDCLVSADSTGKAVSLVSELRQLLLKSGFRLKKWASNCPEVLAELPKKECSGGSRPLPVDESVGESVLGLNWDLKTDHICVKVKIPDKPLTRRGILSMSHSLFDPLGVVAPVLLEPKLVLRELKNREWDEQVTEVEAKRWESWLASLYQLENLQLSRCIKPTK